MQDSYPVCDIGVVPLFLEVIDLGLRVLILLILLLLFTVDHVLLSLVP